MADPTPGTNTVDSDMQGEKAAPLDAPIESNVGVLQPHSALHKSMRRVSEWEALQIAQAGDLETINAEVDEIEAELQLLNLRSTWYKPLLKFNNPKMFNYLLVGKPLMIIVKRCRVSLTHSLQLLPQWAASSLALTSR